MNRFFFTTLFAIGLAAIAWVGAGFIGTHALALAMTVAIAAVYGLGAWELMHFRAATNVLASALADVALAPADFGAWLARLPSTLQTSVRLRIEGERAAPLPGPALTPYLVGLLVMLGMLGTFLGMVVTFQGAVFALESSTNLENIRAALGAPIKGLGLSFGTSVAGVAASAVLGLLSALSRRERQKVVHLLDTHIAGAMRPLSLGHQRQEAFKALQTQALALPAVVDRLQALMDGLERRSQQSSDQLLAQQERFHHEASAAYTALADAVGTSLQHSLVAGARAAGDSIQPVVEAAMARIAHESAQLHERVLQATQTQLDGLVHSFGSTAHDVSEGWRTALRSHADSTNAQTARLDTALAGFTNSFAERSAALLNSVESTTARTREDQAAADARRLHIWTEALASTSMLWRTELEALREAEAARGAAAIERLAELQAALASHLATLGAALEAPMSRLMHTASEVPQAAAAVIAQLRQEMTRLGERDNRVLEERTALMETMRTLLEGLNQAAEQQRGAITTLVESAATVLDKAGSRFSQTLGAQADQATGLTTQAQASASELASLGAAFHQGVQLFSASNEKLLDGLQRVESALGQSTARSDEQLAYYVGQAREVIDLSMASQQQVIEDLRRLRSREMAAAEKAPA